MRRPYIVGNWKMNCCQAEACQLAREVRLALADSPARDIDVGLAPPSVWLLPVLAEVNGAPLEVGAQNAFYESSGAFTGEISPQMLVDAGCRFVIIGHSERRQHFDESNKVLRKKIAAGLEAGLKVIYCIGETLQQREANQTFEVLKRQLSEGIPDGANKGRLTIAYEPVWAIGTGRNATPDQAQEVHQFIRRWFVEHWGPEPAGDLRIQYGGSVKPANARALLSMPDVDGALVGGASLKAADFLEIVESVGSRQSAVGSDH